MLNLDEIRKIFKSCKVLSKETDKNFIIKCPYCGDRKHKGGHDHEHCYVSKYDDTPVYHCFYCGNSGPITKLLFDLTGKNDETVAKIEKKLVRKSVKIDNSKQKIYKLPLLDTDSFPYKTKYMKIRTFNLINVSEIQNLIFDVDEFFKINNIDPIKDLKLTQWEVTLLQHNFVVFLSKHHSMLYCRNINPKAEIKFRKIFLQKNENGFLDYYEIDLHRPDSNTIILSEGNFDILGCFAHDSLSLNGSANIYASGCTFSYGELLKSVCFDRCLYNADVYVLSDNDKQKWHYKNFIKNAITASSIKIVYNRFGKDFGVCEQQAVKLF